MNLRFHRKAHYEIDARICAALQIDGQVKVYVYQVLRSRYLRTHTFFATVKEEEIVC